MSLMANRGSHYNRLIPYLLFAIAVHVLALYLLNVPLPHLAAEPVQRFEVDLSTPLAATPRRRAVENKLTTVQQRLHRPTQFVEANPRPSLKPETPPAPSTAAAENIQSPLPHAIPIQSLLDSARSMGNEDEKYHPTPQGNLAPLADRPVQERLASILAGQSAPKPGTTHYADGTIKVVTAYGTVYCTKISPDLAKTGPLPPETLTMTCP